MSKSLEDQIHAAGNPVSLLRNSPRRADTGPTTGAEFSNWRDEQQSWRESCALFDLSHHMTDLNIAGPDAIRLLSDLGVNSLGNFVVGKAKQLIVTNYDGQVIGDAIVDYMSEDKINLAATPASINWVQFHIETGGYDVTWNREEATADNPKHHPELYRLQVNGPAAMDVLAAAHQGTLPEIKFFGSTSLTIGGLHVRALGHNMSRDKGAELQGPWAEQAQVRDALFAAGQQFGLTAVGSKAPTPAALESGWFPSPLPAVYTGDSMKAFRQWLPATSYEATGSLGGSFDSDDITDYYVTPAEIGYGRLVKFDHDFIGRDALERLVDAPHRRKVTLEWNTEDVMKVIASGFEPGLPFKGMDLPFLPYATFLADTVLSGGAPVGISNVAGYTYNARRMLSLAVVDADIAEGSDVSLIWGEPGGESVKPQVERHRQTEIRAVVRGVPYADVYYT